MSESVTTYKEYPYGTPTASRYYTGRGPEKAFDRDASTLWDPYPAGSSEWIQMDYGAGVSHVITKYGILPPSDYGRADVCPKSWYFQGSNNGSTWTTLDTRTSQTYDYPNVTTKEYEITNTTAYRFYRLQMTAVWHNEPQIGEMYLWGSEEGGSGVSMGSANMMSCGC